MVSETRKTFVAGHNGLVGSALVRKLSKKKNVDLILRNRDELDLLNQQAVLNFFKDEKIDDVYLAAAKVGGILANNTKPAEFIYENLIIQNNVIHSAYLSQVEKLLFLGSSCIYPKESSQPIKEEYLLTGPLENTNEPYAIAKIAGIKMCESYNRQYGTDYRSIMPTNLYGQNDNFCESTGHVIPSLITRFHNAKTRNDDQVVVWGTGNARRDFLHVDDAAGAAVHVMEQEKDVIDSMTSARISHINVGSNSEISINELAILIADVVGFRGKVYFDSSKPDGTMRKILDCQKLLDLGWRPSVGLREGLQKTYSWYCDWENQ